MRAGVVLVLVAGCSFRPGALMTVDDASPPSDDSRMVDASGATDAPADSQAAPSCPAGYTAISGGPSTSQYKIYGWAAMPSSNLSQTWSNAKTTCSGTNTHLAFPNTQSELTALRGAIPVDPSSNYFWIGLTDVATEGTWLTVLGGAAPYLNWSPGQPNGGTADNCVFGRSNGDDMFDWNCTSTYAFACECEP